MISVWIVSSSWRHAGDRSHPPNPFFHSPNSTLPSFLSLVNGGSCSCSCWRHAVQEKIHIHMITSLCDSYRSNFLSVDVYQVVVGSFLAGNQHEQRPRKQKHEVISTVTPTTIVPFSTADPIPFLSSPPSLGGDNRSALPADAANKQTDINAHFPEGNR